MISNLTKKHNICETGGTFSNVLSRAKGLMFTKRISRGYIFILDTPRRIDLHMFFVFYPIDVLFLNAENKVVEMLENFRPFTVYLSKKKVKYVIELPKNTINSSRTEIGDAVKF